MFSAFSLILVTALAAPLQPRAGGPAIVPIPSNCTVANPLPPPACSSTYKLSDNFTTANLVYQSYYDSSLSEDDTWTQCIEQCYGFGTKGTCNSALLAYDVPYPSGWFGLPDGEIAPTACLMFSTYITTAALEQAPEDQYRNEHAGNIQC